MSKEKTTEHDNPFAILDRRGPAMFQQNLHIGAANSALNPLYCPPQIFVAWASEQGEGSINELRYEKGYELATVDMVTTDPKEAQEKGLICLRYFTPDSTGRHVKYRELFLMVTKREWWENRQKLANERAKRDIEGLPNLMPGIEVEHQTSTGRIEEADKFFTREAKE